jgi:hypothetical protein
LAQPRLQLLSQQSSLIPFKRIGIDADPLNHSGPFAAGRQTPKRFEDALDAGQIRVEG